MRTEIKLEKTKISLDFQSKLMFIGSCFAENIGELISIRKFKNCINPLGISYNPYSLLKNMEFIMSNQDLKKEQINFDGEKYFHFAFHGTNNRSNQEEYLQKLSEKTEKAHQFLTCANVVFLSLGTSHVFEHQTFGIVNNCHKQPNQLFERKLLDHSTTVSILKTLCQKLSLFNPAMKIIFTVSPIRHLRDGLVKDRRSKSVLISALSEIIDQKNIFYFPSYEILVDDLRDYRFYKADMIHPSQQAIAYIWESFKSSYFNKVTLEKMEGLDNLIQRLNHIPRKRHGVEFEKFISKLKQDILAYPELDFSSELKNLEQ